MGSFSIWHWLIVAIVILLVFGGRGKIANILGEVGKGLKNFKKEMTDTKKNSNKK
jgi:sec-independent protein translocase protein TatA